MCASHLRFLFGVDRGVAAEAAAAAAVAAALHACSLGVFPRETACDKNPEKKQNKTK